MNQNELAKLTSSYQLDKVIKTNDTANRFGLTLTKEDAELVVSARNKSLQQKGRIELGESIIPSIIYEFCDSEYIEQGNYTTSLIRLTDIFYLYKNETEDLLKDDELLLYMKLMFENVCRGDFDELEGSCLFYIQEIIQEGNLNYYLETDFKTVCVDFDPGLALREELYIKGLSD